MKPNIKKLIMVMIIIMTSACEKTQQVRSEPTIEKKQLNWLNITGRWSIKDEGESAYLYEDKGSARNIGFSELVNHNSIISTKFFNEYDRIECRVSLSSTINSADRRFIVFFNTKNFRDFYGFLFEGNNETITKVTLIKSEIIDPAKSAFVKWNFRISRLQNKSLELSYNSFFSLRIDIKGEKAQLSINNEKIDLFKAERELFSGKIGFASRNCNPAIDDFKLQNNGSTIFEDPFDRDTIKRLKARLIKHKK